MRRLFSVLLSLSILLSLATPAMAAPSQTSGAASTLRLEAVEGTAQMKDASGKSVKTTSGSRLYNGYALSTQKASYAYVSLDNTKAIKLDASSGAEVFQSGKKLEMKVTAGQMFFNATAPLKSGESMKIRTSTMVTGVRGTSGWIEVADRYTTRISLLEGELTIVSIDPVTGDQRSTTIVGGQTLTIVFEGKGHGFDPTAIGDHVTIQDLIDQDIIHEEHIILTGTGLTVEALQEEDVPPFVAIEVANDEELQKKIFETTTLSVPEIIDDAEKKLAEEEAVAEAEDQKIRDALDDLAAEEVDPLFEEEEESTSGGGSSGTAPATETTLTNPASVSVVNEALAANDIVNVSYDNQNNILTADNTGDTVTVESGKTLNFTSDSTIDSGVTVDVADGGTLNVASGATVTNSGIISGTGDITVESGGTLTNDGFLSVDGTTTVENGGTLTNSGTIDINSTNSLNISGTLDNYSMINVGNSADGAMRIYSGAIVNNYGEGMIAVGSGAVQNSTLEISGTLNNEASLLVGNDGIGSVAVNSGGIVNNSGNFTVNSSSTLTNAGTISGSSTVNNYGTLISSGTISSTDSSAIMIEGGSTRISGGTVESTYYTIGSGSISGSGGAQAIMLLGSSQDENNPVLLTIENGSVIRSAGSAIGTYTVGRYGYKISISDSTVSGSTYGIDCSGFTSTPVSAITISNSTITGSTAANAISSYDAAYVTVEMDAATEKNNASASDAQKTYTVYFNPNNGSSGTSMPSTEFTVGIPKDLPTPTDIWWDGYTLTGWNTQPDGKGTSYALCQRIETAMTETSEIILYAQWRPNTFSVAFDLNGGSGAVPATIPSVTYGDGFDLPTDIPEKTDGNGAQYFFAGWGNNSYGTGKFYSPGATVSDLSGIDGETVTLYAVWGIFKVVYDPNGGTGTIAPTYFTGGQNTVYLPDNTFSREGYAPAGYGAAWSSAADGSGSDMSFVNSLSGSVGDVLTVYAVWWPTVTFDANGGSGSMEALAVYPSSTFSLTANAFTYEGRTFAGWNTAADGSGTAYTDAQSIQLTTPITLYAQWA